MEEKKYEGWGLSFHWSWVSWVLNGTSLKSPLTTKELSHHYSFFYIFENHALDRQKVFFQNQVGNGGNILCLVFYRNLCLGLHSVIPGWSHYNALSLLVQACSAAPVVAWTQSAGRRPLVGELWLRGAPCLADTVLRAPRDPNSLLWTQPGPTTALHRQ